MRNDRHAPSRLTAQLESAFSSDAPESELARSVRRIYEKTKEQKEGS